MNKHTWLLLLSPLFLAMTCSNKLALSFAKETSISTKVDLINNTPHLITIIDFNEPQLAKKNIDSVQFIFTNQIEDTLGIVVKEVEHLKVTDWTQLNDSFALDNSTQSQLLEVRVRAKLFKKAKYLQTEYMPLAQYDLSQYK